MSLILKLCARRSTTMPGKGGSVVALDTSFLREKDKESEVVGTWAEERKPNSGLVEREKKKNSLNYAQFSIFRNKIKRFFSLQISISPGFLPGFCPDFC